MLLSEDTLAASRFGSHWVALWSTSSVSGRSKAVYGKLCSKLVATGVRKQTPQTHMDNKRRRLRQIVVDHNFHTSCFRRQDYVSTFPVSIVYDQATLGEPRASLYFHGFIDGQ